MWIALIKKVLKDLLSPNPWNKIDPDNKFRDRLKVILGRWEFAKLSGILHMYDAFEKDFFKTDKSWNWRSLPLDGKVELFVPFINGFAVFLEKNNLFEDAEFLFRASVTIKNDGNPAHFSLVGILLRKECLKEAAEEAKAALKAGDFLEKQMKDMPKEILTEFVPDEYHSLYEEQQKYLENIIEAAERLGNND